MPNLTAAQVDRACGALLGAAAGDSVLAHQLVELTLGHLGDPDALSETATAIGNSGSLDGIACASWVRAIRRTVLDGHFDEPLDLGRATRRRWVGDRRAWSAIRTRSTAVARSPACTRWTASTRLRPLAR